MPRDRLMGYHDEWNRRGEYLKYLKSDIRYLNFHE